MAGVLVHVLPHQVSEVDEQFSGLRHAMVWPGCEVEVPHGTRLCRLHLQRSTGHATNALSLAGSSPKSIMITRAINAL